MAVTFRDKFGSWILLNDALQQRLAEMPELADGQAQLEGLIDEAQGLARRQEKLRGELAKVFRQRREAEDKGEELRQRLYAAVQYKLGFRDEDPRAFGAPTRSLAGCRLVRPCTGLSKGCTPLLQPCKTLPQGCTTLLRRCATLVDRYATLVQRCKTPLHRCTGPLQRSWNPMQRYTSLVHPCATPVQRPETLEQRRTPPLQHFRPGPSARIPAGCCRRASVSPGSGARPVRAAFTSEPFAAGDSIRGENRGRGRGFTEPLALGYWRAAAHSAARVQEVAR